MDSLFSTKAPANDKYGYLRQVAVEFPYFSPAQFCFFQQMDPSDAAFQLQASRTSILFNNAYWLQFQLQESVDVSVGSENVEEVNKTFFNGESLVGESGEKASDFHISEPGETIHSRVEQGAEPYPPEETTETAITDESHPLQDIQLTSEQPQNEKASSQGLLEPLPTENEAIDITGGNSNTQFAEQYVVPGDTIQGQAENFSAGDVLLPGEDDTTGSLSISPNELTTSASDNLEETQEVGSEEPRQNPGDEVNEPEIVVEETSIDPDMESDHSDTQPGSEEPPFNFKLNLDPVTPTEETLTFEPLHTTDYFASQGIKLSGEIKTNDKLGKQLKSFTEWLKTMKKVHTDPEAELVNPTDLSIQKLAEKSNTEDEVVTEAMADVLVQQGKTGKAIEVYKKLSLQNPSKNAYFAAKIGQLK